MGMFSSVSNFANSISPMAHATGTSLESMIPGIGDSMAAEQQNAANIKAANNQMAFQERMSNTAYQRAMTDMKKAGLNPMLAFSQGGASAPSGAMPTINSTSKTKLGEMALSTATGIKGLSQQQQQIDQQGSQIESSINLNKTSSAKQVAEIDYNQALAAKTRVETEKMKRDLPRAQIENKLYTRGASFVDRMLESVDHSAKSFSDAFNKPLHDASEAMKHKQKLKQQNLHKGW